MVILDLRGFRRSDYGVASEIGVPGEMELVFRVQSSGGLLSTYRPSHTPYPEIILNESRRSSGKQGHLSE